jgi:hypothetical protein
MGTGDSSGNTQTVCIRDLVSHSYRVIGTFETCPNKSGDPLGLISRLVSRYFFFLTQEGYFIAYKSSTTWDPPPPPAWGRGSKQEYYWYLLCLSPDIFIGCMKMKNLREKASSQWDTRRAARPISSMCLQLSAILGKLLHNNIFMFTRTEN